MTISQRRITIASPEGSRRRRWSVYLVAGTLRDGRDVIKAGITMRPDNRLPMLASDGLDDVWLLIDLPDRRSADRLEKAWTEAIHRRSLPRLDRGTLTAKGDTETVVAGHEALDCVGELVDAAGDEIERLRATGLDVSVTEGHHPPGESR